MRIKQFSNRSKFKQNLHGEHAYSAHQKSGDRVRETVEFYVVITYTFVSELSKIMVEMIFT